MFINFLCEDIKDFFKNIDDCKVNKVKKRNEEFIIEKANLNKLKSYKNVILNAIKNNKDLSRTNIRSRYKKEYMYLYRYDKEWLFNSLPMKVKVNLDKQRISWNERDTYYLRLLKEKYDELIIKDPVVRITKGCLAKSLGILANIEKKLNQLPETKKFLEGICESTEQFQTRRCQAIIDKEMKKNIYDIRLWKIQRKAGIRSSQFIMIKLRI